MRPISDDMPEQVRKKRQHFPPELLDWMRSMRTSGMSITTIASATGVSKSAVHRYVVDIDVDNRFLPAPKPYWLPKVKAMIAGGMTANQVAKTLRLSSSAVYWWLAK